MAQAFKETAHLKTDTKAYGESYDRIFGTNEGNKRHKTFLSPFQYNAIYSEFTDIIVTTNVSEERNDLLNRIKELENTLAAIKMSLQDIERKIEFV